MPALETRLMRYASDPDPGTILDPGALSDAAALLQATDDLLRATTVIAAVGYLHYLRWMAGQDDAEELQVAIMLCAPLLDGHTTLLPKPVRLFLARERKRSRKQPRPGDNPAQVALRAFLAAEPAGQEAAWGALLWQLSLVLHGRYERTGEAASLGEAIAVLGHAVEVTRPDDPRQAGWQANLGAWELMLYQETGQRGDLRDALRVLHPALAGAQEDGQRRPAVVSALGSALHDLFVLEGDLDALDGAIRAHRDALRELPPDGPDFGRRALNLASALLRRFERTQELACLNEAIEHLKAARAAAGRDAKDDPSVRAALSNNLSVALRERYERTGEQQDLDEAITQGRRAAGEAVTGPVRGSAHGTLGRALLSQYLRYADAGPYNVTGTSFLDQALEHLRQAVASYPAVDPRRARALSNLGTALWQACAITQTPGRAAEAARVFGEAADSPGAAPSVRAQAGIAAGRLAADRCDWPVAARYLCDAVGRLELAVPRGLRRRDREHQLSRLRDLACDAAACAWRNGDAERAAVLFEQGRGVLLAQEMDTLTDLELLRARREDLADRFEALRQAVEHAGRDDPADADNWSQSTAAERRGALMDEWNELIAGIRRAGFPGFLLPPGPEDLLAAAAEGPIVFVNVSRYGSAAFLLQASGISDIDLPGLTLAAVRAMVAELLTIAGAGATAEEMALEERDRRLAGLLGWLWDVIAGPVLDRLGFTAPVSEGASGPRVWWCPSGLLSFLPLHAAGYHGTRGDAVPRTVMDRVISSYVPTIRMLQHTRRVRPGDPGPTLIVAPGHPGVPGAAREAATVGAVVSAELLGGEDATPQAVLSALRERGRVHFACHAFSDLEDPSGSYLELHGGQPLAVSDVAALRLAGAEFAFLAASSTYQPGAALADEAIHLGSAFQLAGFPQVIATLWPVIDSPPARRIAEKVYRGIAGPAGLAATAAALHRAARDERDRAPHAPLLWAAHVHSGA
jgi:tetratricopeptide (TPR) repeat protein